MAGLAKQTVVLSAAKFANYGLMLVSPMVLVRLLSVAQFGEYRQFILYASFLQLVGAFSFADSLLYFIPAHHRSLWRVIAQTNLLVLCSSGAVVLVMTCGDLLTHGAVVGQNLLPLAAYVMLFVNLDFWESYFLATHRPVFVFAYSAGRLAARMIVVIVLAYVTSDVRAIIWSLVALEAARLAGALIAWKSQDRRSAEPPLHNLWRDQLRYCVPTGLAMLLYMANRYLGAFAVTKTLGPVALAHYTIGTYADYIYVAVGSSIAAVLLPEMVRRHVVSSSESLKLWQRVTIVNTMLLLPAALFLARFARPLIVTAFGLSYEAAVPVLQIHMLFLVRACVDFSPALRAISKTQPLIYSNTAALLTNALMLLLLLSRWGIRGAVTALVVSSFVEAGVLGWWSAKLYGLPLRRLVPLAGMGKVLIATLAGAVVIVAPAWNLMRGLTGVLLAGVCFFIVVAAVLRFLKVEEAALLWGRLRGLKMLAAVTPRGPA